MQQVLLYVIITERRCCSTAGQQLHFIHSKLNIINAVQHTDNNTRQEVSRDCCLIVQEVYLVKEFSHTLIGTLRQLSKLPLHLLDCFAIIGDQLVMQLSICRASRRVDVQADSSTNALQHQLNNIHVWQRVYTLLRGQFNIAFEQS